MRLGLVLALVVAGAACAQDDFTDIPDFPDTPAPSPSATVPPPVPFVPKPLVPTTPLIPSGNAATLIRKYEALRLKAFTDRVLTVEVRRQQQWGGDARRSEAIMARGDEMLERGDEIWRHALRTGEGERMPLALRFLEFAHHDYKASRHPPRDYRHGWRDSRPQAPVEEPVIWNRYDRIPLE